MDSFLYWLLHCVIHCLSLHCVTHWFTHSLVHGLKHSFIDSFMLSRVHHFAHDSFDDSLIHSCHWFHFMSFYSIDISASTRSLADAPHNFTPSLLLHLTGIPISHWFSIAIALFRNFRLRRARQYLLTVLCYDMQCCRTHQNIMAAACSPNVTKASKESRECAANHAQEFLAGGVYVTNGLVTRKHIDSFNSFKPEHETNLAELSDWKISTLWFLQSLPLQETKVPSLPSPGQLRVWQEAMPEWSGHIGQAMRPMLPELWSSKGFSQNRVPQISREINMFPCNGISW